MRRSVRGGRSRRQAVVAATTVAVDALRRITSGRVRMRPDSYQRQVLDAEVSALARLRDASQLRDNLMASASHEFRTPLTAIRGSAITLLDRYGDLPPPDRDRLLTGIVEHADRLGRLLEDMLSVASADIVDRGPVTDVTAALRRFSLGQPRPRLRLLVAPGISARIDRMWLGRILDALGEHLRRQARSDAPVELRACQDGYDVIIQVSYRPTEPSDRPERLFEPFTTTDSARTGRPASLALYVARRLAEMHGGYVSGNGEPDGQVTLRVLLRGVRPAESGGAAVSGGQDR